MKVAAIAFTDNGMKIANKLVNFNNFNHDLTLTRCGKGELSNWANDNFYSNDAIIFIGAVGIAIRAIAPYIQSKVNDPAVIVIDELGQFSIPILSGHIGGANEVANEVAKILNAVPVITTATDINNVFAIDTWAKNQGLIILNPQNIKLVSSKLLRGEIIHIKTDYFIKGSVPKNIIVDECNILDNLSDDTNYDVIISHKNLSDIYDNENTLFLIPQIITLGIGCKKNISFEIIERAILNALNKENCHILSLKDIASIDRKANEKGILDFANNYNIPYLTYSADELNSIKGDFSKSKFVKSVVQVDNVCERSAIMQSKGEILRRKDTGEGEGVAIALAIKKPILSWEE